MAAAESSEQAGEATALGLAVEAATAAMAAVQVPVGRAVLWQYPVFPARVAPGLAVARVPKAVVVAAAPELLAVVPAAADLAGNLPMVGRAGRGGSAVAAAAAMGAVCRAVPLADSAAVVVVRSLLLAAPVMEDLAAAG